MATLQELLDLLPSDQPGAISAADMRTIVEELWGKLPATHADTHAAGQADEITPAAIGAESAAVPIGRLRDDNLDAPRTIAVTTTPAPITNYNDEQHYNGMDGSAAAGTLTIPTAGFYLITARMDWEPQDTGAYSTDIFINGIAAEMLGSREFQSNNVLARSSATITTFGGPLSAGDVFDLRLWIDAGTGDADLYDVSIRLVYLTAHDPTLDI